MTAQHSPTPWRMDILEVSAGSAVYQTVTLKDANNYIIAVFNSVPRDQRVADCALVLRSVRSHEAMRKALHNARARFQNLRGYAAFDNVSIRGQVAIDEIDAALALAEGKK